MATKSPKKSHRQRLFSPISLSIIATLGVFFVAYIFQLSSSIFPLDGNILPEDDDKKPTWNTTISSGSDNATVTNKSSRPGELVLWPGSESSGNVLNTTSSGVAGAPEELDKKESDKEEGSDIACTLEYYPVCGADGRTYSNPCMANRAKTIVAHDGGCTDETYFPNPSVTEELPVVNNSEIVFDTGSYFYYQNANYSFYLPKYVYYSGYGARSGATHTVAVALTASGIDTFDAADVKTYFYRTTPSNPPAGKMISVANGVLYIEGDTSNAKIAKIIDTITASAK